MVAVTIQTCEWCNALGTTDDPHHHDCPNRPRPLPPELWEDAPSSTP